MQPPLIQKPILPLLFHQRLSALILKSVNKVCQPKQVSLAKPLRCSHLQARCQFNKANSRRTSLLIRLNNKSHNLVFLLLLNLNLSNNSNKSPMASNSQPNSLQLRLLWPKAKCLTPNNSNNRFNSIPQFNSNQLHNQLSFKANNHLSNRLCTNPSQPCLSNNLQFTWPTIPNTLQPS